MFSSLPLLRQFHPIQKKVLTPGVSNFQVLGLQKQSGIDVLVNGNNVMNAYNQLKKQVTSARLRELERRYFWNIKPKHQRQMTREKLQKYRRADELKEKIAIAKEIIASTSQ